MQVKVHCLRKVAQPYCRLETVNEYELVICNLPVMAKGSLRDTVSSVSEANRWKLDREIDFEHRNQRDQLIPEHLGRIAEIMVDWEGVIADCLKLSEAERSDIREKSPNKPSLQR